MTMQPYCEIIFIRHGETDWNKTRRLQGNLDIPLNDTGREQVEETAKIMRNLIAETPGTAPLALDGEPSNLIGAHYIYSSPLSRAKESAQILAHKLGYPEDKIIYDEGLQEWNAGEIQGFFLTELEEKCPEAWKAWRINRDPHYEFNGGESFAQRRDRVVSTVQSIAEKHLGKRVVVVSHSGVIDEVFRRAKNVPMKNFTRIPKINAGIYIVHIYSSRQQPSTKTNPLDQSHNGGRRHHQNEVMKSKWKILRWGLQKVRDRKSSIEFGHENPNSEVDLFSTEYA